MSPIDRDPRRASEARFAELLQGVEQARQRRAATSGEACVGRPALLTFETMVAELSALVLDQDAAVERVSRALAAPLNGLKLRPHRPNGVFLFNGTTGVGKTRLAEALATVVYGSADDLIAIDCSEFADGSAVNRLIGPPPGYVGHNEPEGWLTTRVAARPRSVVLFDEIEKAGPPLWNTLLQVCDAGRLTDARGIAASFAETIVVLTGNIGAASANRAPIGFAGVAPKGAIDALDDAVRRMLPPEWLSRLDDVVTFEPLRHDSLRRIARTRAEEFATIVADRGWRIEIGDDVLDHIVNSVADPGRGARQIERVLEREVLSGLAGRSPGSFRSRADPRWGSRRDSRCSTMPRNASTRPAIRCTSRA